MWSHLTTWAKRLLDGVEDPLPEDATDFDIRTRALTRPTYTETMRPTHSAREMSARLDFDQDAMGTVRESPVVASVYVRYEKSLENQAKAVQARAERQHRDEIRQQMATEQYEETQERRNRVRGASKAAKYDLVNRNREKGQIVRDERREISEIIEERREELRQQHSLLFESLVGRDARLDAQEEAADKLEREQATADKIKREAAVAAAKKRREDSNRLRAESMRMEAAARKAQLASERDSRMKQAASEKREYSSWANDQNAARIAEHKARAIGIREDLKAQRARAEEETQARRERIEEEGRVELEKGRFNKAAVKEHFVQTLKEKTGVRNKIFGGRYVDRTSADQFAGSAFRKLHTMDDKADAEIAEGNLEILKRIENVVQRTDDCLDDEEAALARVTFAEESVKRKAQEQAEISQANAEMRDRIRNKQPVVDDLLDTEAAALRRIELAEASEMRRQEEAEKARQRNAEMRERLANVKAKTDDDVTDDESGAARIAAAKASAARKKAEAERIARENAEYRQRMKSTAARTDDDIMDEEEGRARLEMAAQSKKERKEEAARLAKENKAKRDRLKNVKAVVDDDIDDDAAGALRQRMAR